MERAYSKGMQMRTEGTWCGIVRAGDSLTEFQYGGAGGTQGQVRIHS